VRARRCAAALARGGAPNPQRAAPPAALDTLTLASPLAAFAQEPQPGSQVLFFGLRITDPAVTTANFDGDAFCADLADLANLGAEMVRAGSPAPAPPPPAAPPLTPSSPLPVSAVLQCQITGVVALTTPPATAIFGAAFPEWTATPTPDELAGAATKMTALAGQLATQQESIGPYCGCAGDGLVTAANDAPYVYAAVPGSDLPVVCGAHLSSLAAVGAQMTANFDRRRALLQVY